VVSIFTYRDDRKLFAVAGAIIVAALLALLQLDFTRSGRASPLTLVITTVSAWEQLAVVTITNGTRDGFNTVVHTPQLAHDNGELRSTVAQLSAENRELNETLARVPAEASLARAQAREPTGIPASVIGYDPENALHVITIDRGAKDHVQTDDGVMTGEGVVGRVVEVDPLSAKVLLINDPTSRLTAQVQKGRWWAIAVGTLSHVKLRFISQDAKLRVGDRVVTGEGRSFRPGVLIGRIMTLEPMNAGALDQSAVVEPAANLGGLTRVLVVPK
jgi:rod shape-determining protein MreC